MLLSRRAYRTAVLLCAAAGLAGFIPAANASNIVQNPGFEDPTLDFWTTSGFNLTSSIFHSGLQSVVNTSCAFGCSDSISQILATTASVTYSLSFWAFTTNSNNPSPEVKALWNGVSVFDQSIPATVSGPWVQYTVSGLTAPGSSTPLQFTVAPAGHLFLDDVSVSTPVSTQVPEPATWSLMASAVIMLAGMSALGRRRRDGASAISCRLPHVEDVRSETTSLPCSRSTTVAGGWAAIGTNQDAVCRHMKWIA